MNNLFAFILFLTVRLVSVFIVITYFVADEYWQSLEVAHKITFGYGHLTWEWIQGIRSYFYPAIIAGIYKLLALFNSDTVDLLITLPRIFQAIISAIADYRFYVWCGRKKWSVFLMIVSYFWFYTGSRTLANTFETALTTIALSYYPWEHETSKYLWFALLCCYVRPTAAIIWAPLFLHHLTKSKVPVWKLLFRFLVVGLIVFGACITIDAYFYGRFIITPIEFLKYNVLHEIGSFYGTHPWYWYFTVGLPTVLGITSVPFVLATAETIRHKDIFSTRRFLLLVILFTLAVLSLLEHKEFRFVLPLLPICLYISCDTLVRWSHKASKIFLWIVAIALFAGNAYPLWYLSTVHQRGPLDAMMHLSKIAKEYKNEDNQRASILFLMPCHSTPFYSHVHENITMRFLTCEPNLNNQNNYLDEAEEFYKSPNQWIRSHLPVYPKTALPTHVVLYDPLAPKIADFLTEYDVLHKIFHAEYINERTGKYILIYERHIHQEEIAFTERHHQEDEIENDDVTKFGHLNDEL